MIIFIGQAAYFRIRLWIKVLVLLY